MAGLDVLDASILGHDSVAAHEMALDDTACGGMDLLRQGGPTVGQAGLDLLQAHHAEGADGHSRLVGQLGRRPDRPPFRFAEAPQ